MQSVVARQAPITLELKEIPRQENKNKQKVVHTITEAHLHLRQNAKKGGFARVRIRYMRYAVQVATETEKTTYYPAKIDRMEITTRRRKIDIKNRKKSHIQEGRERKKVQVRQRSNVKQDIKKGRT